MARLRKFLLCLWLLPAGPLWSLDVEIGGLRKVRASVQRGGAGLLCEVSFLPVSCFDASTNQMVNQKKAREYALLALARNAGIASGAVSAPGLRPVSPAALNGDRLTQVFEAAAVHRAAPPPPDGNRPVLEEKGNPGAHRPEVRTSPSLLSCMDDMRETLRAMVGSFEEQTTLVGQSPSAEDSTAALEAAAEDAFTRFEREVKSQPLLLQVEKQALLEEAKHLKSAFLRNLKAAYESARKP